MANFLHMLPKGRYGPAPSEVVLIFLSQSALMLEYLLRCLELWPILE